MEVHGEVAPGFEAVRTAFESNFERRGDVGASVAISLEGEMIVDLWGGTATYDHGDGPWARDTIINVWSTTKTMAALCCLVLADRGRLDLHEPIATYWPEFAAHGKGGIATRHVLSHSAGLSGWDRPLTHSDLLDHEKLVRLHADQEPWWTPGTRPGYHALSQGYLLGEVVRRVDGRSLGRFFADEIAGPLEADFHIGTDPVHDHRIAHVIPPPDPLAGGEGLDPAGIAHRTLTNPALHAGFSRTPEWRRAEIPAAGGHGNARAVSRIHTATANGGGAFGTRLLSAAGVERIFEVQVEGDDLVLGLPQRLGMGFGLPHAFAPFPNPRTCFWGGWGGSLALIDVDAHVSFAYVMNNMAGGTAGDLRSATLLRALYGSLGPG